MSSRENRLVFLRILSLIFVISLTVLIVIFRNEIDQFKGWGYPGIFLISLLANATILLPAPGVAFVFAMGNVLNPFWVALLAGTGGTLGEISGYLAGFSGQAVVEKIDLYNKIQPLIKRHGALAILILSAIPNPFFDLAGIAAGALKMKLLQFLFFCWLGQLVKMSVFSFAGYYSLNWILGN